jgi:hypothetical protein
MLGIHYPQCYRALRVAQDFVELFGGADADMRPLQARALRVPL